MTQTLNLILHCGGEPIERAELANIPTPAPTESWQPVSHAEYVDIVRDELENAGLRVVAEAHGVTNNTRMFNGKRDNTPGGQYFGMMQVVGKDCLYPDYSTVVGLRGSHIRTLSRGLALGSGVFVCDNLAFSGQIVVSRRHTNRIFDDLRPSITDAILKLLIVNNKQHARYEEYKSRNLDDGLAEVIMIDALRQGAISKQQLPKMVQQWDVPDHEEFAKHNNAWRLFNAATEALKGSGPHLLPQRSARLHSLLDRHLDLEPLDTEFAEAA